VVAIITAVLSALVGGVVGGYVGSRSAGTSYSLGPVPPALTNRPADSMAGIAARVLPGVVMIKVDGSQGTDVGIAQIVAEELDLPSDRVSVVMDDTTRVINQGGASGSFGITWGGKPMRHAAAQARQTLLGLAAKRLNAPVEKLTVSNGVISVADAPAKTVTPRITRTTTTSPTKT